MVRDSFAVIGFEWLAFVGKCQPDRLVAFTPLSTLGKEGEKHQHILMCVLLEVVIARPKINVQNKLNEIT